MAELKPCPFCGGEAEFVNFVNHNPAMVMQCPACFVKCKECGAQIPHIEATDNSFEYKELAEAAWNRRCDNGK